MFGIDRKILDDKFLRKLSLEGCLPAFFVFKNRKGIKDENKVEWLMKFLPEDSAREIKNTDYSGELEFRKKLLPISNKLLEMPMQALIHPMNGRKTNERLIKCREDKIKEYETALRRKFLNHRNLKIVTKDINKIRKAIVWLNWFVQNKPAKKPNMCFSGKNLENIFFAKDVETAFDILLSNIEVKEDKKKLKKIFKLIPQDLNKKELLSYFSSLSIRLSELWALTRKPKKNELFDSYAMFLEDKPKKKQFQYPIFYLFKTGCLNNMDLLEELSDLGYKRINDLGFLNLKNENNTKDAKASILKETKILQENFSEN